MSISISIPVAVVQTIESAVDIMSGDLAIFTLKHDEISIHLTDNSRICWLNLTYYLRRERDIDTPFSLGLDFSDLKNISNLTSTLGRSIKIDINRSKGRARTSISGVTFYSPLKDSRNIPQTEFAGEYDRFGEIITDGANLDLGIKAAGMVSEAVNFHISQTPGIFTISTSGDLDSMKYVANQSMLDTLNAPTEGVIEVTLTKDYIQPLQASIPDSSTVTYRIGEGCPARISYDLPSVQAEVVYYIRRRVK